MELPFEILRALAYGKITEEKALELAKQKKRK
jgi:hypothetical protein